MKWDTGWGLPNDASANIMVYANRLLHGAYPAMLETAKFIPLGDRSTGGESKMILVNEVLNLIPGAK
jgi:hypothetical protein